MPGWLLYGANGYTGGLIAREAARRGLSPTLAGRNEQEAARLAAELSLEHRTFGVADPPGLAQGITGHPAVLHCAGPFSHTVRRMVDACLRSGIHYLDITGEEDVLDSVAQRGAEAQAAKVMLLPGAGLDVVPSDCLAVHLKRRLPSATRLALAFQPSGPLSRGTALTVIEGMATAALSDVAAT
jgi:short subunit dehydrogenase-like uncharacterized protein